MLPETDLGLIKRIKTYFSEILKESEDPIFIQLNDIKICNENFAKFLGFNSTDEFEKDKKDFPNDYVTESTISDLTTAYREAKEHYAGSTSNVAWIKKDNATVRTDIVTVPFPFEDHILVFNDIILIYQPYK